MDTTMVNSKTVLALCCVVVLGLAGCSRQQSDWEKARAANSAEAYEQFLKSYPNGEFTAQAQARVKELYEERDWQKARDADTPEAYQAFLKQYPAILAGLTHKVVQSKSAKGTVYRLQAFGVTEKHAHGICRKLKAKSQACIVIASRH